MFRIKDRCLREISLLAIILMSVGLSRVYGLATESIGNKPLSAMNYRDLKNAMPVIDHESRVYQIWVNGNEHFYYQGDTETLNDVLAKFADIEAEVHEVIIRPGHGQTKTFDGEVIKCNWLLHIVGGISKHSTTLDMGAMIWSKYPQMTVFIGNGEIELDKIQVPKGVTIIEVDELSERYTKALDSSDKTVRGWGSHRLAGLDPYSKKNVTAITKLLDDKDDWVHLNAIGALVRFGKIATSAIHKLKELSKDSNEKLRKKIEEAIKKIENAEDDIEAANKHRKILKEIKKFHKSLPEGNISQRYQKPITCFIESRQKTYKLGQTPEIAVQIKNNSAKDIYLVGSLDASDCKWRYPHCYFEISRPDSKPLSGIGRCGNMNSLRKEDFVKVPANTSFDPYKKIADHSFFSDYHISTSTFNIPGTYRIKFIYSTDSENVIDWLGDHRGHWEKGKKNLELLGLFKKVPKIMIESNEITIQVIE